MYFAIANHLAFYVLHKEELRRKEKRRRKRLTTKQLEEEKAERQRLQKDVKKFLDDEAIESDCDVDDADDAEPAEAGLKTAFKHDEYLDTRGRRFVKPRGKTGKLFRVTSREYYLYKKANRKRILARSLRCKRIRSTM